jgi:hypothetical protein
MSTCCDVASECFDFGLLTVDHGLLSDDRGGLFRVLDLELVLALPQSAHVHLQFFDHIERDARELGLRRACRRQGSALRRCA